MRDNEKKVGNHTMTIEFHPTRGLDWTVTCHAPENALCRAIWACGCESWERSGVDKDGVPWHENYEPYTDASVRCLGKPGGECNYKVFIDESDCRDELGTGKVTFPVGFRWDGEWYEWFVEEAPDGADKSSESDG